MERRDVHRLQHELEELFSDVWQVRGLSGPRRAFRPHVDCYVVQDPPALTVVVDLAGVDPDTVQIVVADGELVLSGERQRSVPDCPVSFQQMEIPYGPFERRIALVEGADPDDAEATYARGLLTVVLPIARRPPRPRVSITLRRL